MCREEDDEEEIEGLIALEDNIEYKTVFIKWICAAPHNNYDFVEHKKYDELNYVNTYTYRASQLNHATGECTKTKLSCRTKKIEGEKVQRDLYSAFLLWHSEPDGKHASTSWCKRDWRVFVVKEREFRARAAEAGLPRNSCFGF